MPTLWIEEYEACGCSCDAWRKKDLPGYCGKHGNNRLGAPYKVPMTVAQKRDWDSKREEGDE